MAELDLGMVRPALVDNLTSTRTDAALTAKQGKVLNDSIAELTDYTSGTGVVASSHITESEFSSWTKLGRVCVARYKFTVGSAISSNTEILYTGYPAPLGAEIIGLAHNAGSVTGGEIRLRISPTGALYNGYTPGGIQPGQWEGSMTYITAE